MLRSWLCTIIFLFLSHDPPPSYLTISHHLTPILGTNVPVLLLFSFVTPPDSHLPLSARFGRTDSYVSLFSVLGPFDSYVLLFSVLGRLVMVAVHMYISWLISEVGP